MNNTTVTASPKQNKRRIKNDRGEAKKEEECDAEAWNTLSKSFKQVQSVLDHNSDLIKQVNANHKSKIPDNLVKNVSLIREINGNISKDDDFKPAGLGFTALYAYVIRLMEGIRNKVEDGYIDQFSAAVNITARITVFPCDYIVDDNMGVELGLGGLSNY
ncbi:hypothetical protein DKX38_013898 [Salix brachista]|uniref:Protein EARLY FLOWERING 4 domain-containing protein n=1 Tax=Salix brachista TaxID=2182728 RepID=A0A5N5LDT3_9ROSI|nr:hypothetical protein DKX38_013898 [Salix brachista]